MLGHSDVGHRVVVRRFVRMAQNDRPLFGDLIGELISFGDDRLVLRTADGTLHEIALGDIVAGKRVPPWRPSNRRIRAIELAAAEAWPAPDTEPLGEWLLRAAEGWTNRANSALAVGDPGLPLGAAIETTVAWYATRGLTPRITTPLPIAAPAAEALAERGWIAQPTTLVQTAPLAAIPAPAGGRGVELATAPPAEWLAEVAGRKGTLPPAARHILTAVPEVRFASVYAEGGLVATGRGAVTGEWLGVSLVGVALAARRLGLARRITQALAEWAGAVGATRAYLQVEADNEPALALYAGLGFRTHHEYVTWRLDGPVISGGPVGSASPARSG